MIPLRDYNPSRTTPWVTYLLVGLNLAVFAFQIRLQLVGGEQAYAGFVYQTGLVPRYLLSPAVWSQMPLPAPLTIFTSMFVHAGVLHLGGNLLYLWIFGDNVEDAMGHFRFLFFYVLCGCGAAMSQVVLMPSSTIPMVGASGAIAGVLGAYLILYPGAQVLTLVFLFVFVRVMYLPAIVLLGIWFAIQIISATGGTGAGVAWFAHIGGFVVGVLAVSVLAVRYRGRMVSGNYP